VAGVAVSDGWLETLGTEPVLGRGFSAAEQSLGSAARSVMISHELWNGLLGGDPDAVGRTLVLDGEPFTLVGVLPEGFHYPWAARLWLMGDFDPNSGGFGAATDQDLEPVRTALAEFSNAVAAAHPDTHADIRFDLVTMREQLFGNRPDVSLVLLGAVLLLLLTASASVAGVSWRAPLRVTASSRSAARWVRAGCASPAWCSSRALCSPPSGAASRC
jgi:hypothetical protein